MQGSWQKRLIERVYNVEKSQVKEKHHSDDDSSPPPKKTKSGSQYPPIDHLRACDDLTYDRHLTAMDNELKKEKPRKEVIAELMRNTFVQRREFVLNVAESVTDILQKYEGLKMADMVRTYMSTYCIIIFVAIFSLLIISAL